MIRGLLVNTVQGLKLIQVVDPQWGSISDVPVYTDDTTATGTIVTDNTTTGTAATDAPQFHLH